MSETAVNTELDEAKKAYNDALSAYNTALAAYNSGSWWERNFGLNSKLKKAKEALDEAKYNLQVESQEDNSSSGGSNLWIIAVIGLICMLSIGYFLIRKK